MSRPEHRLHLRVRKFVRSAVTCAHEFIAFDRGENSHGSGPMGRHFWEKQRGVRAGTADTLLAWSKGRDALEQPIAEPSIWIELKAGDNTPTENQEEFGARMQAVGAHWCWANSVEGYGELLELWGVPLAPNWRIQAQHHDAMLAAAALKVPASKKGVRPRAQKPAPSRVRRVQAIMDGLHAREELWTGVKR